MDAQLHSRYNPEAEAVRYIDSLNLNASTECFILIKPGLGYMIPVLQERFKHSRIISLHAENFSSQEDALKFLESEVPEEMSRISIIEWRPSLEFYKERYVNLLSAAVEFLKRKDAETRTLAAFGKRWIRNFFKNLAILDNVILYRKSEIPVIITGSGPSLEQALPIIRMMQNNCLIIASSSSVLSLAHAGIKPDIITAYDGGSWALKHIYPFFREKEDSFLAVNLCAALPSQCAGVPKLIINDGSFWQSIVLHELSLPSVIITQKGTVTAVSTELAMLLSTGNIYIAGMDLSVSDIRSHTKPYAFDYLFFEAANRFEPAYNKNYIRSSLIKQGGSMDIYAAWFKNQKKIWPNRIYSLTESNLTTNKDLTTSIFNEADLSEFLQDKIKNQKDKVIKNCFSTAKVSQDMSLIKKKALNILLSAIKDQKYSQNLKNELTALLFPGEKNIETQEIENTLCGIVNE